MVTDICSPGFVLYPWFVLVLSSWELNGFKELCNTTTIPIISQNMFWFITCRLEIAFNPMTSLQQAKIQQWSKYLSHTLHQQHANWQQSHTHPRIKRVLLYLALTIRQVDWINNLFLYRKPLWTLRGIPVQEHPTMLVINITTHAAVWKSSTKHERSQWFWTRPQSNTINSWNICSLV